MKIAACHGAPGKIPVAPYAPPDPLTVLLDIWARSYYRSQAGDGIGERGRCAVLQSEAAADLEQLCERAEKRVSDAVQACVESMPLQYQEAILKRCGLMRLWRHAPLLFVDALVLAEAELTQRLRRNDATRIYW